MGLLKKFFDHFSKRTTEDEAAPTAPSELPAPPRYAWPRTTTRDLKARQERKRKRKHRKRGKR
jgi:hypothetical protein